MFISTCPNCDPSVSTCIFSIHILCPTLFTNSTNVCQLSTSAAKHILDPLDSIILVIRSRIFIPNSKSNGVYKLSNGISTLVLSLLEVYFNFSRSLLLFIIEIICTTSKLWRLSISIVSRTLEPVVTTSSMRHTFLVVLVRPSICC